MGCVFLWAIPDVSKRFWSNALHKFFWVGASLKIRWPTNTMTIFFLSHPSCCLSIIENSGSHENWLVVSNNERCIDLFSRIDAFFIFETSFIIPNDWQAWLRFFKIHFPHFVILNRLVYLVSMCREASSVEVLCNGAFDFVDSHLIDSSRLLEKKLEALSGISFSG